MNTELFKVLILPGVLVGALAFATLARGRTWPTLSTVMIIGWLLASMGLTCVARESQPWPVAGYLQNFVAFLGLCLVPFAVGYAVTAWLRSRGSRASTQLGMALVAAISAILPVAFIGPFWAMFLRSA